MRGEMLQNQDVLIRLLVLAVPTVATFLAAVIYTMTAGKGAKVLKDVTSMFLAVCGTSFLYMVTEVILILYTEKITVEMVTEKSVVMFVLLGVLNAISCLAKGLIGGKSLKGITGGTDKQTVVSRGLLYMSIAELPGLAALIVYMVVFMQ